VLPSQTQFVPPQSNATSRPGDQRDEDPQFHRDTSRLGDQGVGNDVDRRDRHDQADHHPRGDWRAVGRRHERSVFQGRRAQANSERAQRSLCRSMSLVANHPGSAGRYAARSCCVITVDLLERLGDRCTSPELEVQWRVYRLEFALQHVDVSFVEGKDNATVPR
jgi:hypothetical protein